jgi:DNA-binding NarL/FixJ family response regulator
MQETVTARHLFNAKSSQFPGVAGDCKFFTKTIFLTVSEVPSQAANSADAHLSARETEILIQLAKGYLMKEIADNLGIGFVTVRTYVSRIYKKLRVHSRAQAVARCLQSSPQFADGGEFKWQDGFLRSRDGKQFKYSIGSRI